MENSPLPVTARRSTRLCLSTPQLITVTCRFFFFLRMKDLSVMDSTRGALYPKIVSIVNQEVFSLEVCTLSLSIKNGYKLSTISWIVWVKKRWLCLTDGIQRQPVTTSNLRQLTKRSQMYLF